jgi:hypothetical protein
MRTTAASGAVSRRGRLKKTLFWRELLHFVEYSTIRGNNERFGVKIHRSFNQL